MDASCLESLSLKQVNLDTDDVNRALQVMFCCTVQETDIVDFTFSLNQDFSDRHAAATLCELSTAVTAGISPEI